MAFALTLPPISQCRLRALRQACFSGLGEGSVVDGSDIPTGSSSPLLLFVAGQDGRNNAGSAAALQYLLLGQSGRVLTGAAGGGTLSSLPDQLEDCVVVVAPDHGRVFVSGTVVGRCVAVAGCCCTETIHRSLLPPVGLVGRGPRLRDLSCTSDCVTLALL